MLFIKCRNTVMPFFSAKAVHSELPFNTFLALAVREIAGVDHGFHYAVIF